MQTLSTVRAVVVNDEGHILVLKRSASDPLAPGMWDLPGGRVELGETIEEALQRETTEEIGVNLHTPQLLFGTSDIRNDKSKTWLFFVAQAPKDVQIKLSDEHEEYQWIRPEVLNRYTNYDILLRFFTYITDMGLLPFAV